MIKVGITGGIGSGKSMVCSIFEKLGSPVYNSDIRAREIMRGKGCVKDSIVKLLGPEAYVGDNPDRAYIADRVFKERMLLASLNGIVHPAVALDFEAWAMSHSDRPYIVMESAILFESGFDRLVDKTITVSCPEITRIERVVSRDGLSRRSVLDRAANQLTDEAREARADYIINNIGSIDDLTVSVSELDKIFRQ